MRIDVFDKKKNTKHFIDIHFCSVELTFVFLSAFLRRRVIRFLHISHTFLWVRRRNASLKYERLDYIGRRRMLPGSHCVSSSYNALLQLFFGAFRLFNLFMPYFIIGSSFYSILFIVSFHPFSVLQIFKTASWTFFSFIFSFICPKNGHFKKLVFYLNSRFLS